MLKNKRILITGGTGSFGCTVLDRLLQEDISEIRIFSRDEKKQDDLRKKLNNNKIKFYIGDVRDKQSVKFATRDMDYIFHAAALKQVPSCEFHPLEAIKTNILGAENVINSAIENEVKNVVCLSTDKAVYPINAMGLTKALMEKIMIAKSRNIQTEATTLCCTRYGNVMASRGSVIPLFVRQILTGDEITITDPSMTRFMMSLDESVNLVLHAFQHSKSGDIFVPKAPAATIETLVTALLELFDKKNHPVRIIGTRHGEKLFETLISREEMSCSEDQGKYYRITPDMRDLNYSIYIEEGDSNISASEDYNSHNTQRLDVEQTKSVLLKLKFIQDGLEGRYTTPEE